MYSFGTKSRRNLIGVHPYLSFFAEKLIERSLVDFSVFEGVRSVSKQRSYFRQGRTHTMDSYHLYGLAVDLVPYYRSRNIWDGVKADAMFDEMFFKGKQIIQEYNLPIQNGYDMWGWDKPHWQMTGWKKKYDIRRIGYEKLCKTLRTGK